MLKLRDEFPANISFQNTKNKHRMRKHRENRNGKEHLIDNVKYKKGMMRLKEKERLKDFAWRGRKNLSEEEDWETLMKKGKTEKAILKIQHPDIVET